ncbi:MAG: bifunctional oligoribonuclease/PAP phosphatase NrnA [Magnetococcales bacterium]|nr:bifunctional oligoribonuclease/PAP phosphatase NrnA [Magnetococcales bacterium]
MSQVAASGMMDEKTQELKSLLESKSRERHVVVIQDYPDPDALSSAFAYRMIAAEFGIECDIVYGGRISHQENLALINLVNIPVKRWENDEIGLRRYQGAIFVDSQGTTTSLTSLLEREKTPVIAMIDHHVAQERIPSVFQDLRPVGACASILTAYLKQGLLTLLPGKEEHRRLATALMHGIISDTGSMIKALSLDFEAAAFLQPFVDSELLMEILHQKRNHKVMEIIRVALADRDKRDGFCIAGVGYLRSTDRDAIPQAADFLLTEENIHTVVVFGVVVNTGGEDVIHGSLRTTKLTLSPDTFLKEALGQDENGHFHGGGKANAGGFEISLGFLSGQDDPEMDRVKWEAFNSKIRRKLLHKIGVETK